MLAWSPSNLGITEGDHERLVRGLWLSGDFFTVIGVRPVLGRLFTAADDRRGCGAAGAVVSYAFWQSQLANDPQVIGLAAGSPSAAIRCRFSESHNPVLRVRRSATFDVAVPICSQSAYWTEGNWLDSSTDWWLMVMGRLKPDGSLSMANSGLELLSSAALEASLRKDYPTENIQDYLHFTLVADSGRGGAS